MSKNEILNKINHSIIISLQAMPNEPLYDENCIIQMARSLVELANVKTLRLAGARDIKNIKKLYPDVTIIGITKPERIPDNYKELVYITPNVSDCKKLIDAGADIIATDATLRKRPNNEKLEDLVDFVKSTDRLLMADIATFNEAKNSYNLVFDSVSTTLSGYKIETQNKTDETDYSHVKSIKENLDIFTILEGKIWEKSQANLAFKSGANSVVIGSAVTRPQLIAKRFMSVL